MRPTLHQRLLARVAPCPDPGCTCLLWGGAKNWKGYGTIRAGKRQLKVHRVAWEMENGPIPDGLVIDHVKDRGCRHRHCVNTAHLEPVTHLENLMRGDTIPAARAAQTHCAHGHLFDEANTYITFIRGRPQRHCRACARDREKKRPAA